jgi:kynurenine formamidase
VSDVSEPVVYPRYDELPLLNERWRAAWGVFGEDDEIGTLGRLTPERGRRGAACVRSGESFPLNWELEQPDPAILGRQVLRHEVIDLAPIAHPGTEDRYQDFWPQGSSQWDALNHIGHPEVGFYNGRTFAAVLDGANGIHAVARHGIAGRFVLADVARYLERTGSPIEFDRKREITVDILEATLAAQGCDLEPGDVLLVRFGWVGWYRSLSPAQRVSLVEEHYFPAPGLSADEETAAWLWNRGVAVVGGDNPILEAMPPRPESPEGFLHFRLIPLLGMTIGELLDLDGLAIACDRDRRYDGLLVAAPLNKHAGSGSPANAVAVR